MASAKEYHKTIRVGCRACQATLTMTLKGRYYEGVCECGAILQTPATEQDRDHSKESNKE